MEPIAIVGGEENVIKAAVVEDVIVVACVTAVPLLYNVQIAVPRLGEI